jgi:hypothetical protein
MALRVGAAFIILMAVNVGFGLWLIARHETKNPNRALLERQMREQIAKSVERAAATLTPGPNALGVTEITVPAANGKLDTIADEVVGIVSRFGGSATKGLQDNGRISVLVDVPPNREQEFRTAIGSIAGEKLGSSSFADQPSDKATASREATADKPPPATAEKKSFIVEVVEQTEKSR